MALVTRYINTASSAGGDGTTNGTTGANRAYVSMAEWEAAENTDLVTATDTHIVYCSGTAADTSNCDNSGWTTDATYFVTISGNPSSGTGYNDTGIYSTSFYRLDPASGHTFTCRSAADSWVVEKLQLRQTDGNRRVFEAQNGTDDWTIRKCIIRGEGEKTIKSRLDWIIQNNVIDGRGVGKIGISCEGGANLIYNNVITGFTDTGINANGNAITSKNNAVFNNADDFRNIGSATVDYNASDDLDGTNAVNISPWADAFTDYTTYDYSPKDASSVLVGAGIGSATDSNVPTEDLTGTIRSTSAPSIGAIEFVATVFLATITESVVGLDSVSSLATLGSSVAESATGTDEVSSLTTFGSSVAESATGTDEVSSLATFGSSVAELATGADSVSSLATLGSSVAESAIGADEVSSLATISLSVAESATGTDEVSSLATISLSVAESATGTDEVSSLFTVNSSVAELAIGTDQISSLATIALSVVESAIGADLINSTGVFGSSVIETSIGSDLITCNLLWEVIDTFETADWNNINASQSVTWGAVNTESATDWGNINASQTVTWSDVSTDVDPNWSNINTKE